LPGLFKHKTSSICRNELIRFKGNTRKQQSPSTSNERNINTVTYVLLAVLSSSLFFPFLQPTHHTMEQPAHHTTLSSSLRTTTTAEIITTTNLSMNAVC